jgi:hypothetical protein
MDTDQLMITDKTFLEVQKWYLKTYGESERSPEELQLLILYKLHQLEERMKIIEHQTKTHWVE